MKTRYFVLAILLFLALFALAFWTVLASKNAQLRRGAPAAPSGPSKLYRPFRVTADHPRIFFNKRLLRGANGIFRRIRPGGLAHEDYERIKKWCDANLGKNFGTHDDYNTALRLFAFASCLDADDVSYGRKAIRLAERLVRDEDARNPAFDPGRFVLSLALVFDWCYERMSAAERTLLAQDIVKRATWLSEVKHRRPPGISEPLAPYLAIGYAALAVWGEPGLEQTANGFLGIMRHALAEEYIPLRERVGTDGASVGLNPVEAANTEDLIAAILAWRTATEEDFFHAKLFDEEDKPYIGSRFLQGLPAFFFHAARPDGRTPKLNGFGVRFPALAPQAFYILAGAYGDSVSLVLGDRMAAAARSERFAPAISHNEQILSLWRIIARPPVSAGFVGTPRKWATFDEGNLAFYKSSLGAAALYLAMIAGKGGTDRLPAPVGHFELSRGADTLITSAGTFETESSHAKYFRGRRFAYNLVVPASPEKARDYDPLAAFSPRSEEGVVARAMRVDGRGQYFFATTTWTLSIEFKEVLTNSRSLLVLGDRAVVVYDHARAERPRVKKRFVLHMNDRPLFVGSENIIEGTEEEGVAVSADASAAILETGDSALFIKFLLPEERIIRRIGGKHYAFNVDGNDYTPVNPPRGARARLEDLALWRLELEAATLSPEADFLVVLAPRARGTPYKLKTRLVKTENHYTVIISEGGWNALVAVSRDDGSMTVEEGEREIVFESGRRVVGRE